jgi:hypothetical protein
MQYMYNVTLLRVRVTIVPTILSVAQKCFSGVFVAGNNETYLGLRVKRPILLSDFNQIWVF